MDYMGGFTWSHEPHCSMFKWRGVQQPPPSRGQMHRCGKSHMCATSGGLSMGQHVVTVLIPITSKISVFRTSSKSSSSWDSWVKNLTHQLLKVFFFVTSFRDDISSEKTFNFFGVGEKNLCYFHGGSTNPTLNGTFNEALLDPDFGGDTLGGDWLLELAWKLQANFPSCCPKNQLPNLHVGSGLEVARDFHVFSLINWGAKNLRILKNHWV